MIPGSTHAYRPDVDGLRAVAVLAVLGYHAFPGAMPGGFAGVDVFFVISGFLITGIILDELKAGRFTLTGFYWRRIRRIFPALILVLAACLLLGWQLLLPDEFRALGKHVAAGAGFVSNIALWREAGYFDAAAEMKPLLHLWSLGIEEQYYLLWPLALLFFFRRSILWLILGVAAVSFALNVTIVDGHAKAAFFLPVTRFWELLAGALLAYVPLSKPSHLRGWLGAGLVSAGFVLLNGERAFPGWWALLPVAGTALLVSAGPSSWVNRAILSRRAVVYVGLISYPLYLWHWPLLSYARIVHDGEAPWTLRCALLGLATVLAALTFELVEKPIRRGRAGAMARRVVVPGLAASMGALLAAGVLAQGERVLPHSAAIPLATEIARASSDWGYRTDRMIRGDSPRAVLFFGDSHMQHYLPRIEQLVAEHRAPVRTVIFKTEGGCAPVPGVERKRSRCAEFVDEGLKLAHDPSVDTVVIAASWVGFISRSDYYKAGSPEYGEPLKMLTPATDWVLKGFEASLASLTREGKRVVLVLSSPRGPSFAPKSIVHRDWTALRIERFAPVTRKALSEVTNPIDQRLRAIAARVGATLIDPTEFLCGPSVCPAVDEKGRPLYMDESHIRASVARSRIKALDDFVYLQKPRT